MRPETRVCSLRWIFPLAQLFLCAVILWPMRPMLVGQIRASLREYGISHDAAIDRFQDAIEAKPGYAIPFRYLGEAQEKKGLKKQAIKSYRRYLDLYPHAEDAAKIKKKLEKLYKEVEKEKKE